MQKRDGMAFCKTGFYRVTVVLVAAVALVLLCSCKTSASGQSSDSKSASGSGDSSSSAIMEQTEDTKDSTSVANLRSAYAEAASAYQMEEGTSRISISLSNGKIDTISVSGVQITSEQANDWSGRAKDVPFPMPNDEGQPIEDATVTFTFDIEGNVTSATYAPTVA